MSALARLMVSDPSPAGAALRRLGQGRSLRLMLRAGVMAVVAAGLVAGGLEVATRLLASRHASGQASATAAGSSSWSDIIHPIALYDLAGTDFGKLPLDYKARRRHPDEAREDVMTFGSLGGPTPYLQLSLLRVGAAGLAESGSDNLADALGRLAGMRGFTATRVHAAASADTRLGRIEAADLLLWDRGAATPCLGFRGAADAGGVLRIAGFACGAPGRPIGRAALACAVDRIDLLSAGDDVLLRSLFVAAERRGGSTCGANVSSGSTGALLVTRRPLGWLDPDGDLPPLRGLFEATNRQR